jgi:uncharacterized protein YlxP (DUF503 family)
VVKGMLSDIGRAHPVAVAEVDHQDLWQRTTLGIAAVSSSAGQVERMLRAVLNDIDHRNDVEVLGMTTSYLEAADR